RDGILIRGSNTGGDTFNVVSTLAGSTTKIDSLGGDDVIHVDSDAITHQGHLNLIEGTLTIEAGAGTNRLIVNDQAGAANAHVVVTNSTIQGLLGSINQTTLYYAATGGSFDAAARDGILVRGSDTGGDTFNVVSTLAGSTTKFDSLGGDDVFHVDS